jgi:hypothetical protein
VTGKRASDEVTGQDRPPSFSVIWYGSNRLASAHETISSLGAQTQSDFELIVEDCGSTDGTLEIFEAAAITDKRIRIERRWNSHPAQAMISALRRCRGDYIAICPDEGHFRPEAFEVAGRMLAMHPARGALATPKFLLNEAGHSLDRPDIVTLLLTTCRPFLPGAILNRRAVAAVGIERDDWCMSSLPLDLSYRLAASSGLVACDEDLLVCRSPQQAATAQHDPAVAINERLGFVSKVFSADGFFGPGLEPLALESKVNQLGAIWHEYNASGRREVEPPIKEALEDAVWSLHQSLRKDHRTLHTLHRLICVRGHNLGRISTAIQRILTRAAGMKGRSPIHIGYAVWNLPLWGRWLARKVLVESMPTARPHPAAPPRDAMFADLYKVAGARYEVRGQIELALEMWAAARPPDDRDLDSAACQAMLKSPTATDASLAACQLQWVRRHLGDRPHVRLPEKPPSRDKIRIGYHCAFMDGDTMRNMMRNVVAAHDRHRFSVFGYSPNPLPADIKEAFDTVRHTPAASAQTAACSDEQFVELARADGLDIFVELTGMSPGHRFGAMSRRIAPVQVSFLNHTGTSQVPNVDYVLSDEICTPVDSDAQLHYSEQIYRLPGCFFCFDYSTLDEPAPVPPPHLRKGYVTFGCFGSGGKIGDSMIKLWADVLHRVPGSVLHIQNAQLSLREDRRFMSDRFRSHGIPATRLVLEGGVERHALLHVYREIDISLDTWPYCGGNTIAESLWHGIPVVTLRGNRFSSAYGASLVTAAGCADLIAESREQYVELAAKLALDSDRLVNLRNNLRSMSVRFGLGDSTLFARRLEAAFLDMLSRAGRFAHAWPTEHLAAPAEATIGARYADAVRR